MVCDLCNASVTPASGTRVAALVMRGAVLRGFNPFTTPGFGSGAKVMAMLGVDASAAASDWRERALKDASDWMLCKDCHRSFITQFGSVGWDTICG